jgi:ABC-2 type transport system ATP-binding protein
MIRIQKLTKYYDTTCAVDNLDIEINKGEIMGLLGPNGAGKTTTLRMLTCYLRPTSGTIKVMDMDINQDALAIKNMIGYLPESAPLYPDMLVYDFLLYVAGLRNLVGKERMKRIFELANLCGINEVMHRPINQLSKGYRQRVGLAHAMMSDPQILVLDEPTSGLDPNQIVEIRNLIKQIGREKTVILSTHILSEVEATCDRIVIINNGRVVADGSKDVLRAGMSGESVTRISLVGPDFAQAQAYLSGLPGVSKISESGAEAEAGADSAAAESEKNQIHLLVQSNKDLRAEIYKLIKKKDWIIMELSRQQRSLENVFRELTLSKSTEN